MKTLYAFVVNQLKKAWTWRASPKSGVAARNIEGVRQLTNRTDSGSARSPHDHKLQQVATAIEALMHKQKLFKNPHLALRELSSDLNVPAYIVTKAMNDVLGVKFYDLINKYRVEEAKQLLTNPDYDRFTILRVAFDAGFNSKTTFNSVFRKFTGMTPSYYKSTCRIASDIHSHGSEILVVQNN